MSVRPRPTGALLALAALGLGAAAVLRPIRVASGPPAPSAEANDPARCAVCHPGEVARWRTSGHAASAGPATPATLPFPLPARARAGIEAHPVDIRWEGGRVQARCRGPDGAPRDYAITHTVGGLARQRYLTALAPDGRAWALPIEFDRRANAFRPFWAPAGADEPTPLPPEDPRYWHGRQEDFSAICGRCHTPRTRFDYDLATGRYAVDWGTPADVGIQCTACHGDATRHVAAAEAGNARPPRPTRDPLPDRASTAETETCGRCHVTAEVLADPLAPGMPYYDAVSPIVLDDTGHFWPDGRLRQETYVFLSHNCSPCFQRGGMRCQDCHDPHGDGGAAGSRARSLAACLACHPVTPAACTTHAGVPTPGRPDCLACHLPQIAVQDGARDMHDHRVVAPDPALTVALGIPNACGDCHADRGADWQAATLARWGVPARPRRRWTEALAAGQSGAPGADDALRALLAEPTAPWPVVASAARLLGRFDDPANARALAAALAAAPHPMVRSGAAFGLAGQRDESAASALAAALADARRAVRVMAAAAVIVRGDASALPGALAELSAACAGAPDQLELRRLLAYGRERAGDDAAALAEWERCARLSPYDAMVAERLAGCRARLGDRGLRRP